MKPAVVEMVKVAQS